jgi:predicted nucleic acid-binding Zn ribbon protein
MAMESCPECSKPVSRDARACPSCGYPIAGKRRTNTVFNVAIGCLGLFIVGVVLLFVGGLFVKPQPPSPHAPQFTCNLTEQQALIAQAQQWEALYDIKGRKIYVTERWMRWPLNDKMSLDDALQCVATGGVGRMPLSYHDYRTGQQLATSFQKLTIP